MTTVDERETEAMARILAFCA